MIEAMINQGIPFTFLQIKIKMYENALARIITDVEGEYFRIKKGAKPSDPLRQKF